MLRPYGLFPPRYPEPSVGGRERELKDSLH